MKGSQGLKSADAANNAPGSRYGAVHGALHGWRGLSDERAGETQLLNFPQREVFRPAPQPAVGAARTAPQNYPTLAANDAAAPKRRGRYNWDGRFINEPKPDRERPSLARRVLVPAGALALLAGVAFGAFYLMHTFAAGPDGAVAKAALPAKAETTVAAAAQIPTAPAEAAPAKATPAGVVKADAAAKPASNSDVAGRIAAPAAQVKTAAITQGAAAVKVPAPDNARWGEAAADKPAAAPQAGEADVSTAQAGEATAAPKVEDPQSAPVPTEAPKAEEAPKKLAYAAPSQASARVDKAVTAALPSANALKASTQPEESALPGVDSSPLSVPAKASANEADDAVSGGGYVSTVHTAVKLHAGPSNGSRSIGVVPGKATVHVLSCNGWCKVSYQGREGYVFKSFLGHAPAAAAAQKAAPEKAAAAQPQPAQQAAKPATPQPADAKALEAAAERTMMRR